MADLLVAVAQRFAASSASVPSPNGMAMQLDLSTSDAPNNARFLDALSDAVLAASTANDGSSNGSSGGHEAAADTAVGGTAAAMPTFQARSETSSPGHASPALSDAHRGVCHKRKRDNDRCT